MVPGTANAVPAQPHSRRFALQIEGAAPGREGHLHAASVLGCSQCQSFRHPFIRGVFGTLIGFWRIAGGRIARLQLHLRHGQRGRRPAIRLLQGGDDDDDDVQWQASTRPGEHREPGEAFAACSVDPRNLLLYFAPASPEPAHRLRRVACQKRRHPSVREWGISSAGAAWSRCRRPSIV